MDKFMALRVFVRVVEHGGFTAAASRLGHSPSAVTKTISRLEDELGAQLFNRSTRRLRTTDFGQEFYDRCQRILADLDDAEAAVKRGSGVPRGSIRAVLPLSFGRVTLAPELPKFFERYPEISLELHFSDTAVDLIAEGFEVAVRTGHATDSRLTTRLLTRGPQVTVASPRYLKRHGEPKTPQELQQHNCLISRFGPDWSFKGSDGKPFTVRVRGNAMINSGDALRETAVAGTGIAQGTWWLYRKDLAKGEVRAILKDYELEGAPVSVLYPPQRHLPAKLRAFIDFLAQITRNA
ncbi:MAG: LysR family transcriptional regulator [Alphaproteobacteria bacterium]|nr:LysR family transcriptional regulator [Alphaproteobacteria bacterium]